MTTPYFEKYDRKGAYHWSDYYGNLFRMNAYTYARYQIVCECVREACLSPEARILDVGCGDGALAGVLNSRLKLPVYGVDTNEKGVALAKQMFAERGLSGDFCVIRGYDTGLEDASFAAAVCSEVIEHVDNPRAMLHEIFRVLVPGGRLIITTPIRLSENPFDPMHVQEWFVVDFVALCREVFGEPLKTVRSHPIIWYELVSAGNRWIGRGGRLIANLLTRLGHNPFEERNGKWRCYTTQTLVLVKRQDAGALVDEDRRRL